MKDILCVKRLTILSKNKKQVEAYNYWGGSFEHTCFFMYGSYLESENFCAERLSSLRIRLNFQSTDGIQQYYLTHQRRYSYLLSTINIWYSYQTKENSDIHTNTGYFLFFLSSSLFLRIVSNRFMMCDVLVKLHWI